MSLSKLAHNLFYFAPAGQSRHDHKVYTKICQVCLRYINRMIVATIYKQKCTTKAVNEAVMVKLDKNYITRLVPDRFL